MVVYVCKLFDTFDSYFYCCCRRAPFEIPQAPYKEVIFIALNYEDSQKARAP